MQQSGDNRLPVITEQIKTAHRNYKKHALQTAAYFIEMGQLLNEAKRILGHGRFGDYLRKNFDFSKRTAQNYMRVAESGLKCATVAHLGLKAAGEAMYVYAFRKQRPDLEPDRPRRRGNPVRYQKRKERQTEQKRADKRMAGWGQKRVPLERPKDGQVLRVQWQRVSVEWPSGTGPMQVAYVWREKPVGPYEGSSHAFASIILSRTDDDGHRTVDCKASYKLEEWGDVSGLPSTTELDIRVDQEIWDADQITLQILSEWREQIRFGWRLRRK